MGDPSGFCIDSSSLIISMRDIYPIESFPGLWSQLGKAFKSGEVISSIIVYEEIEKGEDKLVSWVKEYKEYFVKPNKQQLLKAEQLVNKYEGFVDPQATRESADPYLVALAEEKDLTLVTEENFVYRQLNTRTIKIPNVCEEEKIRCIKIVQMIRNFGWKFR